MGDPTVQQLRYAVALADSRNFSRAAERCFVSQPALSAQIRELESRLGVLIFERSPRGVLLTEIGADVITRARRVLREVDDLTDSAAGSGDGLSGPMRVGIIPTIAPYVLPTAVRHITEAHPDLELYLREERTHVLTAQLQAGELDLVLLALPLSRPGLDELELYQEPFLLAVPERHALATARRRCDVSALAGERLVLLEEGHCLRDQALDVCDRAGRDGHPEVQGTSLPTVVQMVAAGLGVTLLPATTIERDVHDDGRVVVRELQRPAPTRTVGLAWRASSSRVEAYEQLGEYFAAAGRESISRCLAHLKRRK